MKSIYIRPCTHLAALTRTCQGYIANKNIYP